MLSADPLAPIPSVWGDKADLPIEVRAARMNAPLPAARQIAEAVVTARDDLIEIALAPEELGKIRMILSGPDQNPHVMIWVERPEVLDQLRRNAAFLQECLSDAGMSDASFEFGGDTPSGSGGDRPAPLRAEPWRPDRGEQVQVVPLAWAPMVVPARLDIRI